MQAKIIEIKAKTNKGEKIRNILSVNNAEYKGTDHQIDIYFAVKNGRLKLRNGNIENNLIFYDRPNKSEPKKSEVIYEKVNKESEVQKILSQAIGEKVRVDKHREIYFIENVKFHIDKVKELGEFIEIEAIDKEDKFTEKELQNQCEYYLKLFEITKEELVDKSYSDLMIEKTTYC